MLTLFVLLYHVFGIQSVTVNKCCDNRIKNTNNVVKDLKQVIISCHLNDIVIIDVPVIEGRDTTYLLYRPNGDITKLNISISSSNDHTYNIDSILDSNKQYEKVQFFSKPVKLSPVRYFEVFNLYANESSRDIFAEKQRRMKANEFMVGPLDGGDHGNWVLSCIYMDGAQAVEVNQPIVIEITESVSALQDHVVLTPGESFKPQFSYPIEELFTCQLLYPKAAVDRAYDRNRDAMKSCGFLVMNVTEHDAGLWTVIGVGRIVYMAEIWLEVQDS